MKSLSARGRVEVRLVDGNGSARTVSVGHNTLSYGCADAVARMFAGQTDRRPSRIDFVLEDFTIGTVRPDGTVDMRDQRGLADKTNVLSAAIDPNPRFSPSDDENSPYEGNVVTLSAMLTDDAARRVFGFLLKDSAGRVLAARKLDEAVEKAAGYGMSVSWAVTFK